MIALLALLLAAGPIVGAALPQATPPTSERLERYVPRMHDAAAQLDHARRLKRKMYSQAEESRAFWRKLTVEAYQAVRAFHGKERALAVEASFRAGELLRTGGEEAAALDEFGWAARQGEGAFSTRAKLEIAHLHRRNDRDRKALDAYLDVAADARADPFHRDDAWLWAGVLWKRTDRREDALRAWRRVAERGKDPLDRIRAYDFLGLDWLEEGDPEAACGVFNECLRALSEAALEETRNGERVRNALLRMRLVEEIPRAVAERKRSSGAARTSRNT